MDQKMPFDFKDFNLPRINVKAMILIATVILVKGQKIYMGGHLCTVAY